MEGGRGGEERGVCFPPLPSPSPILNPSTSPLKTLFDLSQLSGSINVQDGGTTSFLKTIHGSCPKIRLLCRLLNPSTSPLKTLFDLSQLSCSINVQDGGTTSFPKTIHGSCPKIRLLCRLAIHQINRYPVDKCYGNQ